MFAQYGESGSDRNIRLSRVRRRGRISWTFVESLDRFICQDLGGLEGMGLWVFIGLMVRWLVKFISPVSMKFLVRTSQPEY